MKYADGHFYSGSWLHNLRNGWGMMIWPLGHRYEGYWSGNEREGEGVMIYNDGRTVEGIWRDDKIFEKRRLDWTENLYAEYKS